MIICLVIVVVVSLMVVVVVGRLVKLAPAFVLAVLLRVSAARTITSLGTSVSPPIGVLLVSVVRAFVMVEGPVIGLLLVAVATSMVLAVVVNVLEAESMVLKLVKVVVFVVVPMVSNDSTVMSLERALFAMVVLEAVVIAM